jgi:hypothetical protein
VDWSLAEFQRAEKATKSSFINPSDRRFQCGIALREHVINDGVIEYGFRERRVFLVKAA